MDLRGIAPRLDLRGHFAASHFAAQRCEMSHHVGCCIVEKPGARVDKRTNCAPRLSKQ
jgi:hypothetical protein